MKKVVLFEYEGNYELGITEVANGDGVFSVLVEGTDIPVLQERSEIVDFIEEATDGTNEEGLTKEQWLHWVIKYYESVGCTAEHIELEFLAAIY